MNYDMKKPCDKCPFRTDIKPYLRKSRVREIDRNLKHSEFPCHQTIDYNAIEEYRDSNGLEEDDDYIPSSILDKTKHCAGALILLEKLGRSHQMMRISERFGDYKHTELDMKAPVFDSFEEMADVQPK